MFQRFLLLAAASLGFTMQASAQANCGATPASFAANNSPMPLLVSDVTTAPTFTTQPSGLPNTDFVVSLKDSLSIDALGPAIIGASSTGQIFAPDYGMTVGDTFYVHAFSYDLQQVKVLIHSLYNNSFFPGFTCCAAADQIAAGFCANLSAQGINDSSDVQSVEDFFAVLGAFAGGQGSLSVQGLVANLDQLNANLGLFSACSGGINEICYAVDTLSFQYWDVTGVVATGITVTPNPGAISVDGGTLQMVATIAPANATQQNVVWSVMNVTGVASIDQNGLLTAYANGMVQVKAMSMDGSGVMGTANVDLSNQSNVAVNSIVVSPNPGAIPVSMGTLQMSATVMPSNATNNGVVWSLTAGGFIANIDQNGLLTAIGNNDGTVVVRATAADGSMVYGESTVTLTNQGVIAVTGIVIDQDTAYINTLNGTTQFTVTISPVDATNTNVNWSIIGTPASCDINASGLAVGYTPDTVSVVAEALGGAGVSDTAVLIIRNAAGIATISNDASLSLAVSPNPCSDYVRAAFSCAKSATYQVRMIDMLGKTVWTNSQQLPAGNHNIVVETNQLPAGMYWLQVQYGGGMVAQKVVKE